MLLFYKSQFVAHVELIRAVHIASGRCYIEELVVIPLVIIGRDVFFFFPRKSYL